MVTNSNNVIINSVPFKKNESKQKKGLWAKRAALYAR